MLLVVVLTARAESCIVPLLGIPFLKRRLDSRYSAAGPIPKATLRFFHTMISYRLQPPGTIREFHGRRRSFY